MLKTIQAFQITEENYLFQNYLFSELSIGSEKDISNAIHIHIMLTKVDPATKSRWNDQLDYQILPAWDACSKSVIRRCRSLEFNNEPDVESQQLLKYY